MVAGPRCLHSVGMIWDSNFHPFRRKHNHFRKDNSDAAMLLGLLPCGPWGTSEVLKEEAAARKPPLQVSCATSQREVVVLLSNALVFSCSTSPTWETAEAVAVHWKPLWRQGQLRCWVNKAPWAPAASTVAYLVTGQESSALPLTP